MPSGTPVVEPKIVATLHSVLNVSKTKRPKLWHAVQGKPCNVQLPLVQAMPGGVQVDGVEVSITVATWQYGPQVSGQATTVYDRQRYLDTQIRDVPSGRWKGEHTAPQSHKLDPVYYLARFWMS
ncbi:hypothetical protein PISMIDRAFT_687100 [Pisolithus microcarpus 441]|uniref:Unplaced genomic scaffold scaffold_198, whole genome shotgun sequence n=1 Tax=Pisolithus microcarpus 441 TaxID=765257 RepID=A0A0C9YPB4_9AGAM|nr:hypothetical protein PISMIDRAFT_687100 [Pisolithus microcarpus 441]